MMSSSAYSYAKDTAGYISVPRSTTRIRMVESGRGIYKMMKDKKGSSSGMLEERV